MDCWWNAATESQGQGFHLLSLNLSNSFLVVAIDRVHRIGQSETVYVKHFICTPSFYPYTILLCTHIQVSNTIEGRILQIQKKKTALIKEAFRSSDGGRERDLESLENLRIMFEDDVSL
jgi:DNA repair protein RAD5